MNVKLLKKRHLLLSEVPKLLKMKKGIKNAHNFGQSIMKRETVSIFVYANIQREEILPSEKAFAYKMKLDALKRTAGRPTKENACHNGTHLRSDQELALQVGDSARSIQRDIRLALVFSSLYISKRREKKYSGKKKNTEKKPCDITVLQCARFFSNM